MIVVDTSALVTIVENEAESQLFIARILGTPCVVGSPTKFEFLMVAMGRKQELGRSIAATLIGNLEIETVDWTDALAEIAADCFLRYGKGRHPARLNFGDCMSYALAKSMGVPLLYKGEDFALTDIESAI